MNQSIMAHPILVEVVSMGCMLALGALFWRLGYSVLRGIIGFEILNCVNLTLHITKWAGLSPAPFMSLWISLVLLFAPFVILFFFWRETYSKEVVNED